MKLKSTLTFIAMITFSMTLAPSIMQMDKVFALDLGSLFGSSSDGSSGSSSNPLKNLLGDALKVANSGSSSGSSSNPLSDLFGSDKPNNSPDKSSPSDSSSGSGDNSGSSGDNTCKVDNSQKGTHFYCVTPSGGNSHHHCKPGPDNPGCKKFK
jgi:hypothetical protein